MIVRPESWRKRSQRYEQLGSILERKIVEKNIAGITAAAAENLRTTRIRVPKERKESAMDQTERAEMIARLAVAQRLPPSYVSDVLDQVIAKVGALQPVIDKMRVVFSAVGNAFKSLVKARDGFARMALIFARKRERSFDRTLSIACPRLDREPRFKVFPGGVWFGRPTMDRHAWRWVPRQM